ncbi:DUF2933 domain-containing protein [Chitinimonas lacunae]|uniref:DUF2933 domain-containing protein n=1 Tax=Chitinimonas lacunae TaxID=1963018 RepID=A0ABV8MS90_9NEIS
MQHHPPPSRHRWVFWGFAAIAAFLLLTEHMAHVLGALPYLLLVACPLMHVFMHRGHDHHQAHHEQHHDDHDQKEQR